MDTNPAKILAFILTQMKQSAAAQTGGGFGGGGIVSYHHLRNAILPEGATNLDIVDAISGLEASLSFIEKSAEKMSPKKAERYIESCSYIRKRAAWEFRDPGENRQAPNINLDRLIADFDHLAIELEELHDFPPISEEQVASWREKLQEYCGAIKASPLDSELRNLLLDISYEMDAALRDLTRFGASACAERLRNALGRFIIADKSADATDVSIPLLNNLWTIFVSVTGYVEVMGKWKAFADMVKALGPGSS